MRKIKFGSVEVMGYIGILVWGLVIFCRSNVQWQNPLYLFWLGSLPNLGAAWAATMFARWFIMLVLKREVTDKLHLLICSVIFILALLSEIVHDVFLNSPFDLNDMIFTAAALLLMAAIPRLIRKKQLSGVSCDTPVD